MNTGQCNEQKEGVVLALNSLIRKIKIYDLVHFLLSHPQPNINKYTVKNVMKFHELLIYTIKNFMKFNVLLSYTIWI